MPVTDVPKDPPASAPDDLRALWPLVLHFGISDDRERDAKLRTASTLELEELIAAVGYSEVELINTYLDRTGESDEAVPYGDLAQASMEATVELAAREPKAH